MHTHCLQTGVHSTLLDTHMYSTSHTRCQAIHACVPHNALCIVHAHCQARSVLITHTRTPHCCVHPHAHTHHPTRTVQITVQSIYTHLCTLSCCTHPLSLLLTHTTSHTHHHIDQCILSAHTPAYSIPHRYTLITVVTAAYSVHKYTCRCHVAHTILSLSHTLCSVPTPSLQTHAL